VGEFDDDFMPGADLFEKLLPHARRITLSDAEHHPHQENNSAWLAAVETHLDTVGQTNNALAGHTWERTGA
jgi:hypothetical protein